MDQKPDFTATLHKGHPMRRGMYHESLAIATDARTTGRRTSLRVRRQRYHSIEPWRQRAGLVRGLRVRLYPTVLTESSAPAAMTLLYEIHQTNRKLIDDHEVYIDGGVMRGTDVLKALCLGARGVGLGRPFLYANAVWGEAGCRRVIESEPSAC